MKRLVPPAGGRLGSRTGAGAAAALHALPALLILGALLAASCAGPNHQIVEDRFDLAEASGVPEITEILDVGGRDVPLSGVLPIETGDGTAVVGETLWIRGRSFGRQPTVLVGGRPAAVLGRTREGGIAIRVPPLVPSGSIPVAVSNEVGKGERPIAVRRYLAVLSPERGEVAWAELGADGPIPAGKTAVPGAQYLALSGDGRAAYFAPPDRAAIDVFELPATGGPKNAYRLDLGPGSVRALAAAARAPALAVVRTSDLVLLDTTSPLRPARSAPRALPKEVANGGVVAADISPDGRLLAIALEAGNEVMLLDLTARGQAPIAGRVPVRPEVRAGVLVDVAFSPAGDTLWILSGDNPRSRPVGPQPTELRAVRLPNGPAAAGGLAVARLVAIPEAIDPARLGVGRAAPLVSGAAIRLPPERVTVFLAAGMATGAATSAASATAASTAAGAVFRVGAEDAAAVAMGAPGVVGLPDLSTDGKWLMAPVVAADGAVRILALGLDGRPVPSGAIRTAEMLPARGGGARARAVPLLRIQP